MPNVRKARFQVVLITTLILALRSVVGAGEVKKKPSILLPPKGKTLVAVGSANPEAYTKATGHKSQGLKFFVGLNSKGDVDHLHRQIGQVKDVPGGFLAMTIHLDREFPKPPPPPTPNLSKPWWDGEKDGVIRDMGRALKDFGGLIFADLGGEFDLGHRGIPEDYIRAFRHIHDLWERDGVTNVLYVWHSACIDEDQAAYYPGDDYVDVVAFSAYDQPQMFRGSRLSQTLRKKGKIAAIFESGLNPRGKGETSWSGYYRPMFSLVEPLDLRLVCYNNFGDDYSQFYPPDDPFRDTQMDRMPREIREGWSKMMRTPRFRSALLSVAPKSDNTGRGATQETPPSGDLLFNGKDLSGWTAFFRDGEAKIEDEFTVGASGSLVMHGRYPGYIATTKSYHDFVLSFEWRFPRGGKLSGGGSGVLLALGEADGWFTQGFECQIAEGTTGEFWLYEGSRINGQSAGPEQRVRVPRKVGNERPIGEWNTYEIRCEGRKITVRLNDKLVNEGTSDRPISGRIGLISQATEVEFKDLRLSTIGK